MLLNCFLPVFNQKFGVLLRFAALRCFRRGIRGIKLMKEINIGITVMQILVDIFSFITNCVAWLTELNKTRE